MNIKKEEQERENIESLKYQLKQWRKLIKYLPETDCDRDDVVEIEKLIKRGFTSTSLNCSACGKEYNSKEWPNAWRCNRCF